MRVLVTSTVIAPDLVNQEQRKKKPSESTSQISHLRGGMCTIHVPSSHGPWWSPIMHTSTTLTPSSNLLRDWPGQDCQGAASKGGYPHSAESPIPQIAVLKDTRNGPNQIPVAPTDSSSDSIWWDARLYYDKCFILASSSPWRRSEYLKHQQG